MVEILALLLVAIGALTLLLPAWAFGRREPEAGDDEPNEWRRA